MIIGRVERSETSDELICYLIYGNIQIVVRFAGVIRFCTMSDSEILLRARKAFSRKVADFQVGPLISNGQIPLF